MSVSTRIRRVPLATAPITARALARDAPCTPPARPPARPPMRPMRLPAGCMFPTCVVPPHALRTIIATTAKISAGAAAAKTARRSAATTIAHTDGRRRGQDLGKRAQQYTTRLTHATATPRCGRRDGRRPTIHCGSHGVMSGCHPPNKSHAHDATNLRTTLCEGRAVAFPASVGLAHVCACPHTAS